MVINIDILEGATIEHDNEFYTVKVDETRVAIYELFTGLIVRNSALEKIIIRLIVKSITEQANELI